MGLFKMTDASTGRPVMILFHHITHFEPGPEGNAIFHTVAGKTIHTQESFDEFFSTNFQPKTDILTPQVRF